MATIDNDNSQYGNDAIAARTSDGQNVDIHVTVIFNVNPAKAGIVHVRWRDQYINGFVRPTVRSIIRDEVAIVTEGGGLRNRDA